MTALKQIDYRKNVQTLFKIMESSSSSPSKPLGIPEQQSSGRNQMPCSSIEHVSPLSAEAIHIQELRSQSSRRS